MPTGNILLYPSRDGYVSRLLESNWDTAHDNTIGDAASSVATGHTSALKSIFVAGAGRGAGYGVSRCFFSFDTSGIFNVPLSGILTITQYGYRNASVIYCVKATSAIEARIATPEFDEIEGWDHDADNSSTGTIYAPNRTSWTIGNNIFTLSQEALNDIAGKDTLNICLLTGFDILNTGGDFPPPAATYYSGLYFVGHGTESNRPVINLRLQDDAVFFGANF